MAKVDEKFDRPTDRPGTTATPTATRAPRAEKSKTVPINAPAVPELATSPEGRIVEKQPDVAPTHRPIPSDPINTQARKSVEEEEKKRLEAAKPALRTVEEEERIRREQGLPAMTTEEKEQRKKDLLAKLKKEQEQANK